MKITEPKSKKSKVFQNSLKNNDQISKIFERILQALKRWNNQLKKRVQLHALSRARLGMQVEEHALRSAYLQV